MKTNDEIEKLLLNDNEYDKLVKSKIEHEFEEKVTQKTGKRPEFTTNIKNVPAGMLFSKSAVFEVLNKSSRTKSYINGLQADGFLGGNSYERTKLLNGESDSFVRDDIFVKFVKCKIMQNV